MNKISLDGLNVNESRRSIYLHYWSLVGGNISEGLVGVALLKEVCK